MVGRTTGFMAAMLGLLVLATVASLTVGARHITAAEWADFVAGNGSAEVVTLVFSYRIPRTVLALAVGGALALAGSLIQALTRNPLADPGILGVNAGAAFAIALTIALLGATGTTVLVWPAFLGAALATGAVIALSASGKGPATPLRMTLAGVALGAVLSGLTAGLRLTDPVTFDRFRSWASGSVADADLGELAGVTPYLVIGVGLALVGARGLNALALGEDVARSLGTSVPTTRALAVIGATLLAGAATALAGPIGFLGLMAPHAIRLVLGPDQRRILPLSIVVGAVVLLAADVLARVLIPGREVPVGVVTAFVGAPVLIALIRRRKVSAL